LIGVTGDFVPAAEVIRADYLWGVFGFSRARSASTRPVTGTNK
jgi:hypothetical protein